MRRSHNSKTESIHLGLDKYLGFMSFKGGGGRVSNVKLPKLARFNPNADDSGEATLEDTSS